MHDLISVYSGVFAYGLAAWLTLLFSMYMVEKTYPENNKQDHNHNRQKPITATRRNKVV